MNYNDYDYEPAKPPIGCEPEWLWIEERIKVVSAAIARYAEEGFFEDINKSGWTSELNELMYKRKNVFEGLDK
jgi:hypothetical protein